MIKARAIERGTLKHSKGSKWSKSLKKVKSKNEELRNEINSQQDIKAKLKQRTAKGNVESDSEEGEPENEPEPEKPVDTVRHKLIFYNLSFSFRKRFLPI